MRIRGWLLLGASMLIGAWIGTFIAYLIVRSLMR